MRRRKLTAAQKALILDRQGHKCALTGEEFCDGDQIEFDHEQPLCLGGSNDLDNFRAVNAKAHLRKTRGDVYRWAKARRQGRETGQQARRAKGKTRKILSPGFDKTKTRKFDGTVVERRP